MQLYRGIKIRLLPTPDQEILFKKCAGVARWAYNYFLSENQRTYKETGKGISAGEVHKSIKTLKKTTHPWLKEVSNKIIHIAISEAEKALLNFFKGISGYPKFKSKRKSQPKFYTRDESLRKVPGGFKGEKLGFIRTSKPLPDLPSDQKHYINPRIKYDEKYWYLSFNIKTEVKQVSLTDEVIGIDLGIKELAVLSNGKKYHNINKTKKVRLLEKRLRREQRRLSKKYLMNTDHYDTTSVIGKDGKLHQSRKPSYKRPLYECSNINRQVEIIRHIYRKLANIRQNHIHQTTAEIVKTKPFRIVMEDLSVKNLMKNRHLAKSIQNQKWYEFIRQISYKCENYGIEFRQVPRFYASSKICSKCGNKKELKLSDRTYICDECGLVIDRDLNAAINLMNYKFKD